MELFFPYFYYSWNIPKVAVKCTYDVNVLKLKKNQRDYTPSLNDICICSLFRQVQGGDTMRAHLAHVLIPRTYFCPVFYRKTVRANKPALILILLAKKIPLLLVSIFQMHWYNSSWFCRYFALHAIWILDTSYTRRCNITKNEQNSIELTIIYYYT